MSSVTNDRVYDMYFRYIYLCFITCAHRPSYKIAFGRQEFNTLSMEKQVATNRYNCRVLKN